MKLRSSLVTSAAALLLVACLAGSALGASMILNEYNAVKDASILKNSGSDTYFGVVAGNGGDWMEFVVIQDSLDIRGWYFTTIQKGETDATIVLPSLDAFSSLKKGTILTIAENVPTDLSYAPICHPTDQNAGDWWINYQASFSAGDDTNNDFLVQIFDAQDNLVFGPAGETVSPVSGIGSDEIFKLETAPSALITPLSPYYKDGTSSTFGSPNIYNAGTTVQDFTGLRCVPEPASILALACGVVPLALGLRRRSAR